jgi:hypothetical protein
VPVSRRKLAEVREALRELARELPLELRELAARLEALTGCEVSLRLEGGADLGYRSADTALVRYRRALAELRCRSGAVDVLLEDVVAVENRVAGTRYVVALRSATAVPAGEVP